VDSVEDHINQKQMCERSLVPTTRMVVTRPFTQELFATEYRLLRDCCVVQVRACVSVQVCVQVCAGAAVVLCRCVAAVCVQVCAQVRVQRCVQV
jgi:hypothetical protein